jgi:mono/diheme cytochrome c family protein/peroxiredoxin
MLRTTFTFIALAFLSLRVHAEPDLLKIGPQPLKPTEYRIGERIADTAFVDIQGIAGKLSDYRNAKALVVAMNLVDCPICGKFAPQLVELQKKYQPLGVEFLMVNGNAKMTLPALQEKIAALGLTARYLPDLDHAVGQALGAETSSEIFVLDAARTLVFRGPLSDQFGIGYAMAEPKTRYLSEALDAVLAGETVVNSALSAPGCALGISTTPKPETDVTYHNRISRLIQQNCQSCHRPGEAAPFALMNYADVEGHAPMIKFTVSKGLMPPWFAVGGHWSNDRSLTDRDRETLLQWIANDMPEGDPADAPLPKKWPTDWTIGNPDAVYTVPQPFQIPSTGIVPYQYATVKTDFSEDRWVNSLEIRVTHPEVVHHVLVLIRGTNGTHDGGQNGFFAARVPGQSALTYPEGVAKLLPKGAELVFQIHYTTNGIAVTDTPRLGIRFAPKPAQFKVDAASAYNATFAIPPGDPNYKVEATYTFARPTRLMGFMLHMHLRGKSFRYEVVLPDQSTQLLLDIPRYDFNWQLRYNLATPFDVPAGTILKATAWFDNSAGNPANPDPTATVKWGEQTMEEMMIGYFDAYPLP